MLNKVVVPLAVFLALAGSWLSDAYPSADSPVAAQPAATQATVEEEHVVLLQRSLDMQDVSASGVATDLSQEMQRKQQDTSASLAIADTAEINKQHGEQQQRRQQQQQQQQQHNSAGDSRAEALSLTAKTERKAATSGAQKGKEKVFPSLPPPEEQDRDYIRDESDAETNARRQKEAAQRAAQQAAQQAAKEAAEKDKPASQAAPAPKPIPTVAPAPIPTPEPRLSPEDADFVEDQDNVQVVSVGVVLNMNERLQKDQQKFRQAEENEGASLVARTRLELNLERVRQEAEAAQRAAAGQRGVVEAAESQEAAFAGTAQKAAEVHTLAEKAYLLALNGTREDEDIETSSAKATDKEKGTKARAKVLGKVAAAAKWIMGSNATDKPSDPAKDQQVLQLQSLALEAEALEERINHLAQGLNWSKTAAEAKLVNMTSAEKAKRRSEDKARLELAAATAKADLTISSGNRIASGALEEAESFYMRLVADPAGQLRAAAGPGLKLAVVPLLVVCWAAAEAL
mmetsp:Transcript_97176/g.192561  ORF Transcript_97176/g.192561 Transcript_97176/m.192561 type:complete len:515 (+) Transcript_97176:88-1632(+)